MSNHMPEDDDGMPRKLTKGEIMIFNAVAYRVRPGLYGGKLMPTKRVQANTFCSFGTLVKIEEVVRNVRTRN